MPQSARAVEQRPARLDRGAQQRDVVAEGLAEAARLQEVALHVDDDQGRAPGVDGDGVRLRVDDDLAHAISLSTYWCPPPRTPAAGA